MKNFYSLFKINHTRRSLKSTLLSEILVLLLIIIQQVVMGQPSVTYTTAGTSSYTIPAGVRKVTIEVWGAGGGGGGDNEYWGTGAGGGGGGAYAKINSFTVTPLNSYTYTVGAAGSAGSSSSGNGGNGGNSSFNTTTCVAQGGRGGIGGNDGTGGAGGTTANSTGDIKYAGGAGFGGYTDPNTRGGGGGGSAGTSGTGNSATSVTGATAVTGGGPGGNGGNNSVGLAPASGPGGGGGGGENDGTSGRAGGAGYPGQVRITWACPSISLTSGSSTPNVCVNTAITNIVYTIGDNYVAANVTGLPTGVTSTIVGNTLTISGTPSVTAGSPYNYTITLTKPTGCASDAVATGTITVNALPAGVNAGTYGPVCANSSPVILTGSGSPGTGVFSGTGVSYSAPDYIFTPTGLGGTSPLITYTLTNGACAVSATTNITVNPLPSGTITGTYAVCRDANWTLNLTGINGTPPYTYTYNINGSGTYTAQSTGNNVAIVTNTSVAGTFAYNLVKVEDANCSQTVSSTATVTVNELPSCTVPATTPVSYCKNATPASLTVTGTAGSGTISSYKWYSSPNADGSSPTLLVTNTSSSTTDTYAPVTSAVGTLYYYVVITNSNNCTATSPVSGAVTVKALPTFTAAMLSNISCYGGSDGKISVHVTSADHHDYTFSVNNGADNYTRTWTGSYPDYVITGLPANPAYKVRIKDANGCESEICP